MVGSRLSTETNDPDSKKPEPVEINQLLHLAPIMAHLLDFVASRVPPLVILWWVHPTTPAFLPEAHAVVPQPKKTWPLRMGGTLAV